MGDCLPPHGPQLTADGYPQEDDVVLLDLAPRHTAQPLAPASLGTTA